MVVALRDIARDEWRRGALLLGALLLGLELVTFVAPLTATVMAVADADHVSIASGVNNAVARAASLGGLAVVPVLCGLSSATGAAAITHAYRVALVMAAGSPRSPARSWLSGWPPTFGHLAASAGCTVPSMARRCNLIHIGAPCRRELPSLARLVPGGGSRSTRRCTDNAPAHADDALAEVALKCGGACCRATARRPFPSHRTVVFL